MVYLRKMVIFPGFFRCFLQILGAAVQASPWARSLLSRLGRLLWMEAIDGSPKAGNFRADLSG